MGIYGKRFADRAAGMTWVSRVSKIKVGDKVAYSRTFLQSTGQYTGDVPFARGIVKALKAYGEMVLATIEWDKPDIPEKVNVANLSRVTERGVLDRD